MGNKIERFGGIFSEDDFVGTGADEAGDNLAGDGHFGVYGGGKTVKGAAGAGGIIFVIVGYGFDDGDRF